jgi:hypothetical protein
VHVRKQLHNWNRKNALKLVYIDENTQEIDAEVVKETKPCLRELLVYCHLCIFTLAVERC